METITTKEVTPLIYKEMTGNWKAKFDREFTYLKDGEWAHNVPSYDENDELVGTVRAWVVPDALYKFISEVEKNAREEGKRAGIEEAIKTAQEMLKKDETRDDYRAFNTALHLLETRLQTLTTQDE